MKIKTRLIFSNVLVAVGMLGLVIVMYFYGDLINQYNSLQLEANRITTKVYQTNSALKTTLFTDDFKRDFGVFEKQYEELHTSIENFVENNDFKRIAAVSEESRKERESLIRILEMTDEKYAGTEETAYALIENVSGYLPGPLEVDEEFFEG